MDFEKEEKKRLAEAAKLEKKRLKEIKDQEYQERMANLAKEKMENGIKFRKKLYFALFIFSIVASYSVYVYYLNFDLKRNCTGYLERAANSNTVEIAKGELSKVISYLDTHGLNSGYTSIVYNTPDEDVSFWYANLKASQEELEKVDASTSAMEKSNLLLKLRETIAGQEGIIVPPGLAKSPHNLMYFFGFVISGFLVLWAVYLLLKTRVR